MKHSFLPNFDSFYGRVSEKKLLRMYDNYATNIDQDSIGCASRDVSSKS